MKAISNSSVLIALSSIDQLSVLTQRFPDGILIPQAVWYEVHSRSAEQDSNRYGTPLAPSRETILLTCPEHGEYYNKTTVREPDKKPMIQTLSRPIDFPNLYPESDGKPMAENTLQYRWIVLLVSNLRHLFRGQTVFVAGDLLWYPHQVTEPPAPSQAPDAMVVFGRPAGDRRSYKQWEEDNIAPQVVFEILSESNSASEMLKKQVFYRTYGVLEMFFYDPDSYEFLGLVRSSQGEDFQVVTPLNFPWTSPLLGVRFEMFADGLALFYPNGDPFNDSDRILEEWDRVRQERDVVQQERDRVQQERDRAFARLRELGIDPSDL